MDAKQIKSSLKAAREAIRNKEFKEALKHCKAVLTEDKENYMALVLIAVGAEGLEQYDQALKAYKRATEADDTQVLAWQGLSSFYEKHESPEYTTDRSNVYLKLIELHSGDEDKKYDCLVKLANLIGNKTDPELVENVVVQLVNAEQLQQLADRKTNLQKMLISILEFSKLPDVKEMKQRLCREVLGSSTQYDSSLEPIISQYLTTSSQTGPCSDGQDVYGEMFEKFPSSLAASEYFIIHCLDKYSASLLSHDWGVDDDFRQLVESYQSQKSEGAVLLAARGYIALSTQDYMTARQNFSEASNQSGSIVCVFVFHAWTSLQLHQNELAVTLCQKGISVLTKKSRTLTVPSVGVKTTLHCIQVQAWYSMGDRMALDKSLEAFETDLNTEDKKNMVLKGMVHLKLKDIERAKACRVDCLPISAILEGQILEEEDKLTEALRSYQTAVQLEPNNAYFLLHLAKCQFKQEGLRKESFGHLLKAAKQDPYHSEIFFYLGRYYHLEATDMTRARKCYQKAFDLDLQNDLAGEALCDLLNKEGEEDKANNILLSVTSKASAGCAKWAWLRLGLYQLKHDDPSVAIASLQAALRADPSDIHVWECLGDAYFTRGSYTAALKAFNRASELKPDSTYCLFQMASIKQELAMYTEAEEEYKHILDKSPNYVPALKGLGETYNMIAKSFLSKYLHGRAKDTCQDSLNVLLRAASLRPDLSCLWKLAGDSCTILHVVPAENFMFEKSDKTFMNKLETLEFGGRCYIKAVKIYPECSSLWHDLGMNYFYQSKCTSTEAGSQLIEKAVQAVKKAVQLDSGNHRHWTALGFIACSEGYYKPALAQHCFIKSVQVEHNNAVAWTNLASLYLKHENVKLAHEAFKIAQRLEPSYVSCWIGQAIIAEIVGHEDAMDLFRHTTDLGNHLEGALGYSHWVCTMLQSKDTHDSYIYQYAIDQMAAVPTSSDALARYTDRVKTNPVAYNMYGLLLERQKLYRTSAAQFKCAMDLLKEQQEGLLKEVMLNYARVLCGCAEYEEAVGVYEAVEDLDSVTDLCQSALAFYKCGKLEQSFQAYNRAAEVASTDADKSHILTAVAMVIYKFGNADTAKTKLFESAQMPEPSVHGLKALCALGLIQSDSTLATAAVQELLKLEDTVHGEDRADIPWFTFLLERLQGNAIEGLRKIEKQLILNPCDTSMWELLSKVLLRYFPDRGQAIANASKSSLCLDEQCQQKLYGVMSLGQLSAGYHCTRNGNNNALMSAQRAVYLYPGDMDNWACLAAALHAESVLTIQQPRRQPLLEQELNILNYILGSGNLSLGLKLWCNKQRTICTLHANKHSDAISSLEALLSDFGTEKEVKQFFEVFQNVMKGDVDSLVKSVQTSDLTYYWEIIVEMYLMNGLMKEAESAVKQCVTNANNNKLTLQTMLIRLLFGWYLKAMDTHNENDVEKFKELAEQILILDPKCSVVFLMQGIVNLNANFRFSRRRMQELCEQEMNGHMTGSRKYSVSLARRALIYLLANHKKDAELVQKISQQAEEDGDIETVDFIKSINMD